jgi:hypothetical protein
MALLLEEFFLNNLIKRENHITNTNSYLTKIWILYVLIIVSYKFCFLFLRIFCFAEKYSIII